jgi:protein-S-isoprenylcysteine O-methyltransferase Ste14
VIDAEMVNWINLISLILSAFLFLYFYVKSAIPATLEKRIGDIAYSRCTRYRLISGAFEIVAVVNYIAYFFFPLSVSLPRTFPWDWWISSVIGVLIATLGGYFLLKGLKDAGEESVFVKKEHNLFRGIYKKMRHPQAVGEVTFWWVIAFLLNSPFLALFSFIWIPIFYMICLVEEKDLVIRYGKEYLKYKRNTPFISIP